MTSRWSIWGSTVALLVAFGLTGCSGSSGIDLPNEVGRITLRTGSPVIVADGKSRTRIDVEVANLEGKAMKGVEVELQTSRGSLLQFQDERALLGESETEGKALTNEAGVALAYLESSTTVGTGRLTALAKGADAGGIVQFVAGDPATVIVNASPRNLTADGVSTAAVVVWVLDEHQNPVDTRVSVEQPAVGSVDAPVVDTRAGVGIFTYTAGTTVGAVSLRVETEEGLLGEANLTLIGAVVGTVGLSSSRAQLVANGGSTSDGRALLTITVLGPAGQPMEGVQPTVITDLGLLSLDPPETQGAATSLNAPPTDSLGITQVWLLSSANLGTAAVEAVAGGQSDPGLLIRFVGGAPASIVVDAAPRSATANGTSRITLTAAVYDGWGNPTDTRLTLDWPEQGTVDKVTATTTSGMASFTYTVGTVPRDVTLRLTASNGVFAETVVHLL